MDKDILAQIQKEEIDYNEQEELFESNMNKFSHSVTGTHLEENATQN